MGKKAFETRVLSSLSKVFADEELEDKPFKKASCLPIPSPFRERRRACFVV